MRLLWLYLVLVLLCEWTSHAPMAQDTTLPLDVWVENLSARKDPGNLNLKKALDELVALDSVRRCQALGLLGQVNRNNTRFHIRYTTLCGMLATIYPACPGFESNGNALQEVLWHCYEIQDEVLAVAVHQALGVTYLTTNETGLSVVHYLIAKELMEKEGLGRFTDYAMTLLQLAEKFYRTRDYRIAADLNIRSITYHGEQTFNASDSLSDYWEMNAWNNLGLCYLRMHDYDSAFYAFNRALTFADSPFWKGLILGNRGDVYFMQEKYDSAEALLQYDYQASVASSEYDNSALSLSRLARITNSRGDHSGALRMIKEADALERRKPHPDYRVHILYAYALIYRDLGNADSAFAYMEQYKARSETIERHAAENRAGIVRLHLRNQENVHQIRALTQEKNQIRLIRNFSILLVIILAGTGYLYINRLRLRSKLKHREALEAQRKAETEAAHAREQLHGYTRNLREKTGLIESLQEQLTKRELNEEQLHYINALTHHAILTDEDWVRFKDLFEKVYPGFFLSLKQKSGDITLAEQRMAALGKLQVTIKEAATLLGISPNSVHKTRYRLKQRLGLEQEEDLESYLQQLQ